MEFDVAAYLDRIGVRGPVSPDFETLATIQWAHLQSVPFENLDIRPLGRPIHLDPESLCEKIVRRRRGGFCYELNGLLSEALRAIGYGVTIVSVQFVHEDGTMSPIFDHMALIVEPPGLDDRLLVDVGAGRGSPARPLPLTDGYVGLPPETRLAYRLSNQGERWQMDIREPGSDWRAEYAFTLIPRRIEDFRQRCNFQVESPESHFTRGPICSKNILGGRVSVTEHRLIHTFGGERTERELPDEDSFLAALWEHFGIRLDSIEE